MPYKISVSTAPFALLHIALCAPPDVAALNDDKDVLHCLVFIAEPFVNDFGFSNLCEEIHGTDSILKFLHVGT